LRPQDIQTNRAVRVYIWMIDFGGEGDLGRLERVVCRELDVQEENAVLVGRVGWAHYRGLPVEEIVAHRACTTLCRGISADILELFCDSF